mgnify:CR=1 FL=1
MQERFFLSLLLLSFFCYFVGFFSGVFEVFPHNVIKSAKDTVFYFYKRKKILSLNRSPLTPRNDDRLAILLAKEVPVKIEFDSSIGLNNLTFEYTRIEDDNLTVPGYFFVENNLIYYINQDDPKILLSIGLNVDDISPSGGIKSIFRIDERHFIYVSYRKNDCARAAVFEVPTNELQFAFPCLPGPDSALEAAGGGFVALTDGRNLITTGAALKPDITMLAQDDKSPYGKILELYFKDNGKLDFRIFSKGHRNPQGIFEQDGFLYSIDHGPRGGDELNLIEEEGNYGWPKVSLGSHYSLRQIEKSPKISKNEVTSLPIYSFVPSIAPSSIGACPKSYKEYYEPMLCLAVSALRGRAIYLLVLSPDSKRVLFTEELNFESRIRKFYFEGDVLYAATDDEGFIVGEMEARVTS